MSFHFAFSGLLGIAVKINGQKIGKRLSINAYEQNKPNLHALQAIVPGRRTLVLGRLKIGTMRRYISLFVTIW